MGRATTCPAAAKSKVKDSLGILHSSASSVLVDDDTIGHVRTTTRQDNML